MKSDFNLRNISSLMTLSFLQDMSCSSRVHFSSNRLFFATLIGEDAGVIGVLDVGFSVVGGEPTLLDVLELAG